MGSRRLRYLDFYNSSGYAGFHREERTGGSVRVDGVLAQQDAHCFADPAMPDLLIGLVLAGSGRASWKVANRWQEIPDRRAGHFAISPLDEPIEFDISHPHKLLVLSVDRNVVETIAEDYAIDAVDILGSGAAFYRHSQDLTKLMLSAWRALAYEDTASNMLVDGLAQAVVGSVIQAFSSQSYSRSRRIRPVPIQLLTDYIRVHCGDRMTVSDLAELCDFPESTFGRAFKRNIGLSPYEFIQKTRIDMALEMLSDGQASCASIAVRLGFSDQSHFTRVFKYHLGTTPARYRRDFLARA